MSGEINPTVEVLRFPEDLPKWQLVSDYLKLRAAVFVDEMHWQLHVHDGLEFEQYDTFAATYILAVEDGEILGGARLVRSDHRLGCYTYMIKDAAEGRLDGMPTDLCRDPAPVDHDTWELTRFVSVQGAETAKAILRRANDFLASIGAARCLFLGPPAFIRMAKSMGFAPRPMGPVTGNDDGRFLAFECAVI